MKRILVTGGTGFIGRNLIAFLKKRQNINVIALSRRAMNDPDIENVVVRDFAYKFLKDALAGQSIDAVIHLAAAGVNPGDRGLVELTRVNGYLPSELIRVAAERGARCVVMAGSSAEYRRPAAAERLTEIMPLEVHKLYGATKAAGGILAIAQGMALNIPVAVARIFNAYGPGEDEHRLLPSLMRNLAIGNKVALSVGTQIRDFIYIDDVCQGICAILNALDQKLMPAGAYNLSTGAGFSVADFARSVARQIGADENLLDFGALPLRADDVPYLVGDGTTLKRFCGWHASLSLEQGVAAAIAASRQFS